MPDIFDQIATQKQTGDIFDQLSPDANSSALAYSKSDQGYRGQSANDIEVQDIAEKGKQMASGLGNFALNAAKSTGKTVAGLIPGVPVKSYTGEALDEPSGMMKPFNVAKGIGTDALNLMGLYSILKPLAVGTGKFIASRPSAAPVRHEMAAEGMRSLPEIIQTEPSAPLYEQLSQENPSLTTPNLQSAVEKLSKQQNLRGPGLDNPQLGQVLSSLEDRLTTPNSEGMPFQEIWEKAKGMNQNLKEPSGGIKYLRGALQKDIETANPENQNLSDLLNKANKAYGLENAKDELTDLIEKKGILQPRQGDPNALVGTNARAVIKDLEQAKNMEMFRKAVPPGSPEWNNIMDRLEEYRNIPPLGPVKHGVAYGSGPSVMKYATGELAGKALGLSPEVTGAANVAKEGMISGLMRSNLGRKLLTAASKADFQWNPNSLWLASQALNQASDPETSLGQGVRNTSSQPLNALKILLKPALMGGK